ncbi:hypothetical protein [Nostoc sp. CCY0012]|uniref:hypothetical protein n=1 Tax=Nostoc sp. CCY0012 TaxID=1056123 RepID=UPI0039C6249A
MMIKQKRLIISFFSLSCLNLHIFSDYRINKALANKTQTNFSHFQLASLPPWERPTNSNAPYFLPPWGLTVKDFVVTRQMPLSSGQREVLLVSPSTGSEQRLFINLPNSANFELHEIAFNRVLISSDTVPFKNQQLQASLQNFQVKFSRNSLSEVVLSDGTKAQIRANAATIKSPSGKTLETFQLLGNVTNQKIADIPRQKSNKLVPYSPNSFYQIARSQTSTTCQDNAQKSINQISTSMDSWSSQMSQSSSELVQALGWAIGHGSAALQNSATIDGSGLPELTCRSPVQCEERRVSGGSEIRTDLFDIPQNVSGSEVVLTYEFFTIPDSLEMYYDGNRIFSVGPTGGQGKRTFRLPATARQVGITVKGNDNPNTRWWYVISCISVPPSDLFAEKPCKNVPEFNLKEHPYLTSSDPANDPRFKDSWHEYSRETQICATSDPNCTRQNIYQLMLSQRRFVAPFISKNLQNLPMQNCTRSELRPQSYLPYLIRIIPFLPVDIFRSPDPITTLIDANNYSAMNHTLKGHGFHPGRITRTVVEKHGYILVVTEGIGIGPNKNPNIVMGPIIFGNIDNDFKDYVKNKFLNK